jgi:hypothetical protein
MLLPLPLAYLVHEFNISSTKHVHVRVADERVNTPPPPPPWQWSKLEEARAFCYRLIWLQPPLPSLPSQHSLLVFLPSAYVSGIS